MPTDRAEVARPTRILTDQEKLLKAAALIEEVAGYPRNNQWLMDMVANLRMKASTLGGRE